MTVQARVRRRILATGVALASAAAWCATVGVAPASAIAPAQPATCSFSFGPLTSSGAAGSLGLLLPVIPAVATQECSTTVPVTSTIVTVAGGAVAGGINNNPLSQTVTLQFAPDRLDPSINVFWVGDCTTSGTPNELITQAGAQSRVSPLGTQSTCAAKGTGISSLQALGDLNRNSVGIAPTPGGLGYRLLNDSTAAVLPTLGTPALPPSGFDTVQPVSAPQVAVAATPSGNGDWTTSGAGVVASFGTATFHGDLTGTHINAPIVGMAADPVTGGYWLVGADGGVYSFDAAFHGSAGAIHLNSPIVGITTTPDGGGYWLAAADGGVFSFGDATFWGSAGSIQLNSPVVGITTDQVTGGYWLVAADGGVFSYHAPFFGSTGGLPLNAGVSGIASTSNGHGYWLVAADGGVFTYGNAHFYGSAA